jgi:hypothetical protein
VGVAFVGYGYFREQAVDAALARGEYAQLPNRAALIFAALGGYSGLRRSCCCSPTRIPRGRSASPLLCGVERVDRIVDGLEDVLFPDAGQQAWLARNNAVIMAVLMLIIGVKLIGNAISGFST